MIAASVRNEIVKCNEQEEKRLLISPPPNAGACFIYSRERQAQGWQLRQEPGPASGTHVRDLLCSARQKLLLLGLSGERGKAGREGKMRREKSKNALKHHSMKHLEEIIYP